MQPSHYLPSGAEAEEARRLAFNPLVGGLADSEIRRVAGEVWALEAQGVRVLNLTIGDFRPHSFRAPESFVEATVRELRAGQTYYTPSDGIPELREAVARVYAEELGLDFGPDAVLVAAGARPLMYALFHAFVAEGDGFAHGLPSWNTHYYVYLTRAEHLPVHGRAEARFLPTAEQVAEVAPRARLLVLNSPLNPTGTAYRAEELEAVCRVVLDENLRRRERGERPLLLIYDQVYRTLVAPGREHVHPLGLLPELAPWTCYVDAISKSMASTGVRVGWAYAPPHLHAPLKSLLGHLGAFAPRAEQRATASYLLDHEQRHADEAAMRAGVQERLAALVEGARALEAEGLPVSHIEPEGGIYLSLRLALHGRRTPDGQLLQTNEQIRRYLLERAHVAVVPFQAFGLPDEDGWFRLSVGATTVDEAREAMDRIGEAVRACP